MKLTSTGVWLGLAIAVCAGIVLAVLWLMIGPVLQMDAARWLAVA